jgi:3-hydroxyisobutyrate dehydrogenase-like beta-hydroxyacid dehydrogenase
VADVTILGIGRMGGAISRRLAAAGHHVTVWNRSRAAAEALVGEIGGPLLRVAEVSADAVSGAQFVICALADGDATRTVLLDGTVLSALRPDAVVCDMGTSGVQAAEALEAALRRSGRAFVDAPVSGGVATADAGQLLVMASGDPAAVDALRPVLAAFSRRVAYLGPAGAGQVMKLAVNLVVHDLNAAMSEALVLADRAGIDTSDAYDVFQASVVASPFVNYKREAFLNALSPVAMRLDLVRKDLQLITALARDLGVSLPATQAVAEQVAAACAGGFGSQDMAALCRFVAREAR